MADVFISYARESEASARRAAEVLTAHGYEVWWDGRLLPHRSFGEVIEEQIRQAKAVLVLWSAGAVASQWVRAEADAARHQDKLVQAVLAPIEPPMPFNQYQTANLTGWDGHVHNLDWRKVLASIEDLCGPAATPDPAKAVVAARPRRLLLPITAVLVVALLGVGGWFGKDWLQKRQAWKDPHTVVLPFKATSGDAAARDFAAAADGELAGALNENQVPTHTGRAPGKADFVISGAVDGAAGRLHARVQLQDRKSAVTLWTAEFDGPVQDPGRLRGEIGRRATDAMANAKEALLKSHGQLDPTALGLYIQARDAFAVSLDESGPLFEQLAVRAPDFALGLSSLCNHHVGDANELRAGEFAAKRDQAVAECRRAIAIDPHIATAYQGLSFAEPGTHWAQREAFLRKGQTMDPGPVADLLLAQLLNYSGRHDEALRLARRAFALRKTWTISGSTLAYSLYRAGHTVESRDFLAQQLALRPDDSDLRMINFEVHAYNSPPEIGLALLLDPVLRPNSFSAGGLESYRAFLNARRSGLAADRKSAADLIRRNVSADLLSKTAAAPMLANLGDLDGAFEVANAYANDPLVTRAGGAMRPGFLFAPQTAVMRADPRYIGLMKALGLADYWRASGHWPDFCVHEPASVCSELKRTAA